ncbi:MAG: hypothetical protein QXT63_08275, partial [Thermoplasmata archaeon]
PNIVLNICKNIYHFGMNMKEVNRNGMLARGSFVNGISGERLSCVKKRFKLRNKKALFAIIASVALLVSAFMIVRITNDEHGLGKANENKEINAKNTRTNYGIDIYPKYIAGDTTTPFAVHYSIGGLEPNTDYYSKLRIKNAGTSTYPNYIMTYNYATGLWTHDSSPWTSVNVIKTDATGNVSGWLVGKTYTGVVAGYYDIVLRLRKVGTSTNIDTTDMALNIRVMDMSTEGGWVTGYVYEPDGTTPMQNANVLVKNSSGDVLGIYMTENNEVNEGYTNGSGYYRIAVPIGSGYTIEATNQQKTFQGTVSAPEILVGVDVTAPDITAYNIPEFSEFLLPIFAVVGIFFFVSYRRKK